MVQTRRKYWLLYAKISRASKIAHSTCWSYILTQAIQLCAHAKVPKMMILMIVPLIIVLAGSDKSLLLYGIIDTYVHTYIHAFIHTYIDTCTHTHIQMYNRSEYFAFMAAFCLSLLANSPSEWSSCIAVLGRGMTKFMVFSKNACKIAPVYSFIMESYFV